MVVENGRLIQVDADEQLYNDNYKKFWHGIKVIGKSAMTDANYEEIVIPDSVKEIEEESQYVKVPSSYHFEDANDEQFVLYRQGDEFREDYYTNPTLLPPVINTNQDYVEETEPAEMSPEQPVDDVVEDV